MHVRGNKPAGTAARLIMLLCVAVFVAIVAIGIYVAVDRQGPARGSRPLPGQVASEIGQAGPRATPPR